MGAEREPNRRLAAVMAEAGVSNKGLAARVADAARQDGHQISPDHVSVRRWLDGVEPRGKTPHYIALALGSKLGRRLPLEEIGFRGDPSGSHIPIDEPNYSFDHETAVSSLTTLSVADLGDDPDAIRAPWVDGAAPGLITGFLFGSSSESSSIEDARLSLTAGPADAIRATASHLMDLDFRFGGGHVRRLLLFYFHSEVVPLLKGQHADPVRREIFRAAAEVAELLGWSAYDAGRYGAAQRYYAQGLRLAREAGDELLGGWMLASLSHQANYLGRFNEAVQLARASYSATHGKSGVTTTCLSLAMEARALASLGDVRGCTAAIHKAELLFETQNPDDDPSWIAFFNAEELAGEAAHCYRDLGRLKEVRIFGAQALDPLNTPPRTRAFIGMVNAAGALNDGDLEEAIALASEAVDLGVSLQSQRYLRYLTDFDRTLRDRYPRDPRAIAFSNTLRPAVAVPGT
ncbi:hypothetical protein [Candidatus Frankia nodulisporulans]|uniref:hypothetical protein n=1 Tax=Candidatus Frankia nodulisporulans TaxID=2060052 RepID=UPI0013D2B53B|nr:hypothetical protein [Candidatus Frankia nodulisporulans]